MRPKCSSEQARARPPFRAQQLQQDAVHVDDVPRLRQIHGVQQAVDDLRDEFEGHVHGPIGQVSGGFQQRTTDYVYGGGDVQILSGFTIYGDGVTPIKIIFASSYVEVSANTGAHFYVRRDGGGILTVGASGNGGSYPWTHVYGEVVIAPFTGGKTFTVNMATTSGTGCTVKANGAGYGCSIRAEWAPGSTNDL